MTLTQYNTTVGHTGIARLCLAQWCYRTRTKLAEIGKPPPLQVGEDVTNSKSDTQAMETKNFGQTVGGIFYAIENC